jgi:FKBP-type peptidyl-prolyl cis-trans isomerase FkpA
VAEADPTGPALREKSDSIKESPASEGVPIASVPQISIPELPAGVGKMDMGASIEFVETGSGLKYRILRRSDAGKPGDFSVVEVHYHGWLEQNHQRNGGRTAIGRPGRHDRIGNSAFAGIR